MCTKTLVRSESANATALQIVGGSVLSSAASLPLITLALFNWSPSQQVALSTCWLLNYGERRVLGTAYSVRTRNANILQDVRFRRRIWRVRLRVAMWLMWRSWVRLVKKVFITERCIGFCCEKAVWKVRRMVCFDIYRIWYGYQKRYFTMLQAIELYMFMTNWNRNCPIFAKDYFEFLHLRWHRAGENLNSWYGTASLI